MNNQEIVTAIAENLGIPPSDVDVQAHLRNDLGLNPVEVADLISGISQRFGLSFDPSETAELETVADLIGLAEDKLIE